MVSSKVGWKNDGRGREALMKDTIQVHHGKCRMQSLEIKHEEVLEGARVLLWCQCPSVSVDWIQSPLTAGLDWLSFITFMLTCSLLKRRKLLFFIFLVLIWSRNPSLASHLHPSTSHLSAAPVTTPPSDVTGYWYTSTSLHRGEETTGGAACAGQLSRG